MKTRDCRLEITFTIGRPLRRREGEADDERVIVLFSFDAPPPLILLIPLIAVGTLAMVLAAAPVAAQEVFCTAVDGDTLQCGGERVRVMGLDAPELHARCPEELRLALAATARLRALVAHEVTLRPAGRDRHRRLLAVVLDRGGRDVATILIREGLAREYHGRGPRGGWC